MMFLSLKGQEIVQVSKRGEDREAMPWSPLCLGRVGDRVSEENNWRLVVDWMGIIYLVVRTALR